MLRMFENSVLRKGVTGEMRQIYDEALIDPKYFSGDKIKVDEISDEYGTFV